jgi:hypothetical protein
MTDHFLKHSITLFIAARTWTLLDATTTLVGTDTAQTLTNKVIDVKYNMIQSVTMTVQQVKMKVKSHCRRWNGSLLRYNERSCKLAITYYQKWHVVGW